MFLRCVSVRIDAEMLVRTYEACFEKNGTVIACL